MIQTSLALSQDPSITADIIAELSSQVSVELLQRLHHCLAAKQQPTLALPPSSTQSSPPSFPAEQVSHGEPDKQTQDQAHGTTTTNATSSSSSSSITTTTTTTTSNSRGAAATRPRGRVLLPVATENIALRALLSAALHRGSADVIADLMDFGGDELYLKEWWVGRLVARATCRQISNPSIASLQLICIPTMLAFFPMMSLGPLSPCRAASALSLAIQA